MNDLIWLGKTAGPVGLKGEIKFISDNNHLDKLLTPTSILYIENKEYVIKTSRVFKNNYIISFDNYESINLIDSLLNKDVYIKRVDTNLSSDEFLYSELLNYSVYEDDKLLGKVEEILLNKNSILIKCDGIIIPLIDKYVDHIDNNQLKVFIKDIKELRI